MWKKLRNLTECLLACHLMGIAATAEERQSSKQIVIESVTFDARQSEKNKFGYGIWANTEISNNPVLRRMLPSGIGVGFGNHLYLNSNPRMYYTAIFNMAVNNNKLCEYLVPKGMFITGDFDGTCLLAAPTFNTKANFGNGTAGKIAAGILPTDITYIPIISTEKNNKKILANIIQAGWEPEIKHPLVPVRINASVDLKDGKPCYADVLWSTKGLKIIDSFKLDVQHDYDNKKTIVGASFQKNLFFRKKQNKVFNYNYL